MKTVKREWVGGLLAAPFLITEKKPFRPEMIMWLELPENLVVSCTLIDPKAPSVSFSGALMTAMDFPMIGPARRPDRIRVADAQLAVEVREVVTDIEVQLAPTPELDRILQHMAETMPAGDGVEPSYFEGGRVSTAAVKSLFESTELLYRVAPWQVAHDDQVLRMDIPLLGVEGACVSIIGELGESLGIVIFPSFSAFESFLHATEARDLSTEPIDLGTTTLSLNFERGADLPATMLREAIENGWPIAGPGAYPWVQHRDRNGMLLPLTEREVSVISACATSLTAFFLKHSDLFTREPFEPVSESYFDEDGLELRFSVPYRADRLFPANDPNPSPVPRKTASQGITKVGRNAPCPCGSGKKYKKCCLDKEQVASAATSGLPTVREIDRRLEEQMTRFAKQRFGDAWLRAAEDFINYEEAAQLFGPWFVYHFAVQGKPISQWFLEERRRNLSPAELAWLEAQQATWLSVLEVQAVEPGRSVTFRDLLTDQERTVIEVAGSKTLVQRDAILGRIVDHQGISVLCGCHHRPLPPLDTAEVVRRIRGRLRRRRAVPSIHLLDEKIGRYLIARWEEAVAGFDLRRSVPPKLQNTDGEELLITADHFEFDPADCGELEKNLAAIEGIKPPEPEGPNRSYVFTRPGNPIHKEWRNTIIGQAKLGTGKLRLETNSLKRADMLRQRIETACGEKIRHHAREHLDPLAGRLEGENHSRSQQPIPEIPPEEATKLIRQYKERHYANWMDQPLPALGGKAPRDAVRTKAGRDQVDLLLKDFQNKEARAPAEQSFDFSNLRRSLGLEK